MKWRNTLWVICDRKVALNLKEKIYRATIRPAILYETENQARKSQQKKLSVAKMRML